MLNSTNPDTDPVIWEPRGDPTTTPEPEYADMLRDTDSNHMTVQDRLDLVTEDLLELLYGEYWYGGLSLLLLDGFRRLIGNRR